MIIILYICFCDCVLLACYPTLREQAFFIGRNFNILITVKHL